MYAIFLATQVLIQLVGIERSEGSQQTGNGHQTGVECVVGRALVVAHILTPETFAVQTNIPVRQVIVDKGIDESACTGRVEVLQLGSHLLNEGVQRRENPTVNLGFLKSPRSLIGTISPIGLIAIDIRIKREEAIRII